MARFVNLLGMAVFTSVCACGLEHENLRELDLGYVVVIHKLKNRSRNVNPVYKELTSRNHVLKCNAKPPYKIP